MSVTRDWECTEADLVDVSREVLTQLRPQMDVALVGDLGAGKTTFVRALLSELGVGHGVSSPTYVLCHEHQIQGGEIERIEHWDLYRIASLPEELFERPARDTVRIVEWANLVPEFLEQCSLCLAFEVVDDRQRRIRLTVQQTRTHWRR